MGWLWSSPAPSKPPNGEDESASKAHKDPPPQSPFQSVLTPSQESQTTPNSTSLTESSSSSNEQTTPQTREELGNQEILAFLRGLQDEQRAYAERAAAPPPEEDLVDEDDEEPPELITPARLYPSKMNCLNLFDAAWWCASPGGQFVHLYRYGVVRHCGQHYADMSACWRINRTTFNSETREQKVLQRHWKRERDRLRERGGCSEEVWGEGRRWVEKNAFTADWDAEDSPWRKNRYDDERP